MQQLSSIRQVKLVQLGMRWLSKTFLGIEVVLTLMVAYVFFKTLPRHTIRKLYGTYQTETLENLDIHSRSRARRIGRAIRRAKKTIPWNSTCQMDALAAKLMLNRRRIPNTLYIGFRSSVSLEEAPIEGHAWVRSGNVIVTGAPSHQTYIAFAFYGDDFS